MTIHRFLGAVLLVFALLASPSSGRASEQIPLDPGAPPRPPASTLAAIVAEASSSRSCSLRLVPNGLVTVARPCGLEARLDAVRRWRRCGDSIIFLGEGSTSLFVFRKAGARSYQTEAQGPGQLTLTLLPAASIPLAQ